MLGVRLRCIGWCLFDKNVVNLQAELKLIVEMAQKPSIPKGTRYICA